MNKKYTAIYIENRQYDETHCISITKMKRIEQLDGETINAMLERELPWGQYEFLFEGHPELEG